MAISQSIMQDVEIAAKILLEAGAKEVYVFGSAAHGEEHPGSDIDMAVRGLPPRIFFRTMGKVALAVSRPFDLVDLDKGNLFTEFLERKGELVSVG
ncbi:MAG: nucleotidyltransferase domain-containing protein [Armatimonadetes bacterium]|nr:nucleotidyltransferase domain-containing protein [Armatimonadota bacterium]